MRCPVCADVKLEMTFREGVEIDYCPDCRGIWLDRGELEKMLDRAAVVAGPVEARSSGRESERRRDDRDDWRRDGDHRKRKKRSSFLDDLFDF